MSNPSHRKLFKSHCDLQVVCFLVYLSKFFFDYNLLEAVPCHKECADVISWTFLDCLCIMLTLLPPFGIVCRHWENTDKGMKRWRYMKKIGVTSTWDVQLMMWRDMADLNNSTVCGEGEGWVEGTAAGDWKKAAWEDMPCCRTGAQLGRGSHWFFEVSIIPQFMPNYSSIDAY